MQQQQLLMTSILVLARYPIRPIISASQHKFVYGCGFLIVADTSSSEANGEWTSSTCMSRYACDYTTRVTTAANRHQRYEWMNEWMKRQMSDGELTPCYGRHCVISRIRRQSVGLQMSSNKLELFQFCNEQCHSSSHAELSWFFNSPMIMFVPHMSASQP